MAARRDWRGEVGGCDLPLAVTERVDGQDAGGLSDTTPIYFPGKFGAVTLPKLAAQAATNQFLVAGTYGVTDRVNVIGCQRSGSTILSGGFTGRE